MRALILAGGFATRLHPLTLNRPKPLLPVVGKPILQYILEDPGLPDRPILTTNRQFAVHFEKWLAGTNFEVDLLVEPAASENEKLGSIGAIAHAIRERALDDDLLVIAGDNLFGFKLQDLIDAYDGNPLIALHDKGTTEAVKNRYGVAILSDGGIIEFQEKPDRPRSTLASTACYVYPRAALPLFSVFRHQSEEGRDAPGHFNAWLLDAQSLPIDAYVLDCYWFDVGDRESYIAAVQHLGSRNTWIDPTSSVQDSTLNDTIVLAGSRIKNCTLLGCVVGENCELSGLRLHKEMIKDGTRLMPTA